MNVFLWVLQVLLGVAFLGAGAMKASQPVEKLGKNMTWVHRYSPGTVRFIGVTEILGGLGLILPWATGIAPILTPLAATGLAVIMLLAVVDHARAKEYPMIGVNVLLGALAVIIAIGRF
ncbi:DoxX family protein [Dactylosporangium sp. NPDC000244]|uniref:DoxX family protein n=1 Tax=Dactylosporangium sp. NPDC000244 TaxID=3154365 RepID=UPI003322993D